MSQNPRLILDTNVFRDAQRGEITSEDVMRFKGIYTAKNLTCHVTPLSVIELGSHITQNKGNTVCYYIIEAFKAVLNLCNSGIDDPEAFLRTTIFKIEGAPAISAEQAYDICRIGAASKDYDDFYSKRLSRWNGSPAHVKMTPDFFNEFQVSAGKRYVDDMRSVIELLIPNYNGREDRTRMETEVSFVFEGKSYQVNLNQVLKHLESKDFRHDFVQALARRVQVDISGWTEAEIEVAAEALSPMRLSYAWILRKIIVSGYNFENNKNDLVDLMFLMYLTAPDTIILTADKGFLKKLTTDESAIDRSLNARIMSLRDWMKG